jgi:hypothetical protein
MSNKKIEPRISKPGFRLALLAAAVCVTAIASVAYASLTTAQYCGILTQPKSQCPSSPGRALWQHNTVNYFGSGTVSVCEKAVLDNGSIASRVCGNNSASSGGELENFYNISAPVTPVVGNNSDFAHTITGFASFQTGGPHIAASTSVASSQNPLAAPSIDLNALPARVRASIGVFRIPQSFTQGVHTTVHATGDSTYLRSTADHICLGSSIIGGEFTCQRYDEAIAGQLAGVIVCGTHISEDHVLVFGVVPDGVTTVYAMNGAKAVQSTSVIDNTYRIDLAKADAAGVNAFSWTDAYGASGAVSNVLPPDLGCQE